MKCSLIWLISISYFLGSCSNNHTQLIIQNLSVKDSLKTIVRINGKQIFNDYIPKAITNTSVTKTEFSLTDEDVNVEVEIPLLNLKEAATSKIKGLRLIIVSIRSVTSSTLPVKDGNLTSIPKKEEILIAFSNKVNKGVGN